MIIKLLSGYCCFVFDVSKARVVFHDLVELPLISYMKNFVQNEQNMSHEVVEEKMLSLYCLID